MQEDGRLTNPRVGFYTPSPVHMSTSPTLYFGDVDSFSTRFASTPRQKKAELNRAVREAKDACLWLREAGFPQYVQMFEDGLFPINLSKFQVEKDHTFLNQADIDSLIRRLNTLNRCADMMDEVHNKGADSDDETQFRALSDKWQFRRRQKKWLRRKDKKSNAAPYRLFSSSEDLLDGGGRDQTALSTFTEDDTPTGSNSPLMLVSELRNSLTGLDRAVKTYSFMMSEDQDLPMIQVEGPPPLDSSESPTTAIDTAAAHFLDKSASNFSSFDSEDDPTWDDNDYEYPSGGMENFATGIMDTFETNLLKLKEYQTQSLPDVFQATKMYNDDASTDVSPLSSASVSTASIVDPSDITSERPRGAGSCTIFHNSSSAAAENSSSSSSSSSPAFSKLPIDHHHHHHTASVADKKKAFHSSSGKKSFERVGSAGSYRTSECVSPVGSECSERGVVSSASPQPVILERSRFPLVNGISENGLRNSRDLTPYGGETSPSPLEERIKRFSKASTGSGKAEDPQRESKWHSYQRPHDFKSTFRPVRTMIPIEELSVGQISVLRKLSLVKLTAQIELYNFKSRSNITRMLKEKKRKVADTRGSKVFGAALAHNVRRLGQALPPVILRAMQHLRDEERLETVGLFRRAASKARVDNLKELADANPEFSNFEAFSPYDVADMIKVYFRELPEPLLTGKLSELLIMVQENVPSQVRMPALQAVMLLIPDEHREALQILLLFLNEVMELSSVNQMTAENLAVCFAPTLFSVSSPPPKTTSSLARKGSFKRNTVNLGLSPTQLASRVTDSVVSSHCLTQMIVQAEKLFKVAADMLQVCRFTHLEMGDPVPYYELGLDRRGSGSLQVYLDSCVHTILKEARKKFKGWVHQDSVNGVEVSYLKPRDGIPLWVWRGVVEVGTKSAFIYRRLWRDRFVWDSHMTAPKVVTTVDEHTEVVQYTTPSIPPLTERDHCLLRSWYHDDVTQSYVVMATSVSHPLATLQGGIRATQLATYYLVEPIDSERSRVSYICRVDIRGRSADYYNKAYGPYLASTVSRIRDICTSSHDILETSV